MNRIILIGNGFDLAHGLKTSYKDFINWYWESWYDGLYMCNENVLKDKLCTFTIKIYDSWNFYYRYHVESLHPRPKHEVIEDIIGKEKEGYFQIDYSPFMERIRQSIKIKGWVDIENEYYKRLCTLVKDEKDVEIEELNEEMSFLTGKLIEYLKTCTSEIANEKIKNIIYCPLDEKEIAVEAKAEWEEMIDWRLSTLDSHNSTSIFPIGATSYYNTIEKYEGYDYEKHVEKNQDLIKKIYNSEKGE